MTQQKLIFLDVDGTLTRPGEMLPPPSAVSAIRQARQRGHRVFLCTGRTPALLGPLLPLGFDGAVSAAGGYVFCGDQVLFDHPLTETQRDAILDTLHRHGVFCTLECLDATFGDQALPGAAASPGLLETRRKLGDALGIRPISEYDGRSVYKIVFMNRDEGQLREARETLERDFAFVYQSASAYGAITGEVINRAFDKGRGILRVCAHLGLSPENAYGFGDSLNDLQMIDTVGCGVVMADGAEALKPHADLICPPLDQDGLAWAFQHLGLI
ncbi:MAG: HAD hydrolase family protein [Oscillospiraceae bacterium]|nr:HAD hydrolase family protein [Oscillospiraceae bacterium]